MTSAGENSKMPGFASAFCRVAIPMRTQHKATGSAVRRARMQRGFAMTTEAMFALLAVALAASTLLLFNFQKHDSGTFYLCSDAAIVLAKSGAFSQGGGLQEKVSKLSGLSGMCIRVKSSGAGMDAFECNGKREGGEKFSLEIPVWTGFGVEKAVISCSRPG